MEQTRFHSWPRRDRRKFPSQNISYSKHRSSRTFAVAAGTAGRAVRLQPRVPRRGLLEQGLSLWEGAACWIDNGRAHLQLRENFRKGSYLGYRREEVIAHEAVHAARALFHEPQNEEFFAYATSPKRWRQVLGPLLRRPWEPWLFLITFALGMFSEIALIASLCVLTVGFWRLIAQHRRRSRAAHTLLRTLHHPKIVRAVLFRMTDAEIRTLAKNQMPPPDNTLRWKLLHAAYFNPR